MASNDLPLSDYSPQTELVVKRHRIKKPGFPVIDIHAHFGRLLLGDGYEKLYDTAAAVERLRSRGVRHIVNLDGFSGGELDRMLDKIGPYGDFISTFGNVDISRLDDADFEGYVVRTLEESKKKGIKGLKFWKNISLSLKDKKGRYIPIDDRRLDVIWHTAAELKLPVLIHIADPVAFFKPIDRFNERYEELSAHPDWSFFSPEFYTFEQLLEMQDRLLENNPRTTFIIAHVGSYAENLESVGRRLSRYPNMYVDIADRIAELGRQPYTAGDFFNRHCDRILFGTDSTPLYCDNYEVYYRFLETRDEYFDYSTDPLPRQGRWKIYGLALDKEVLEKIYSRNAAGLLFGDR